MSQTTAPVRETPRRDEPSLPQPLADAPPGIALPPAVAPGRSVVPVRTRPVGSPEPGGAGAGAWIAGWGEFVLLGFLALVGAFFASADADPGDYTCGMILIVAALALAFLRLKGRLDNILGEGPTGGRASGGGASGGWTASLLVDDWANLTAVIVVFVILGLIGLFFAAGLEYGGLHNAGLALFVVSAAAVFLNLKRVFDISERGIGHRGLGDRGLADRRD